jgi:hypothetical protein
MEMKKRIDMKNKILLVVLLITAAIFTLTRITDPVNALSAESKEINLTADDDLKGWSEASKMAVQMMKKTYGEPAEKTASMMIWNNNGPWKRTIVYAEEFQHDFPMPHTDVMQQFVDYTVPAEKFTELAMYDGSVVCNRTNGEISARCDKEGANFLALNLAHDIVTGKKDVKAARDFYATAIKEMINGGKPAYMQKLQFTPASGKTVDKDKQSAIITSDDLMKAKKMMEMEMKNMKMAKGDED